MTKPFISNLLNAVVLMVLGCWGYFSSSSPSFTALIPVIGGGILIALNNGLRRENKVISHIVVFVTLLMFLGLVKPLTGALGKDNSGALLRVSLMMLTSLYALLVFVKSFVDARKKKIGNSLIFNTLSFKKLLSSIVNFLFVNNVNWIIVKWLQNCI